jgi:hypothetical protein
VAGPSLRRRPRSVSARCHIDSPVRGGPRQVVCCTASARRISARHLRSCPSPAPHQRGQRKGRLAVLWPDAAFVGPARGEQASASSSCSIQRLGQVVQRTQRPVPAPSTRSRMSSARWKKRFAEAGRPGPEW